VGLAKQIPNKFYCALTFKFSSKFQFTILLLLLLLTSSHFLASVCWQTFTYPRLLVGLGSVRGRRFLLPPKVRVHVLGICI